MKLLKQMEKIISSYVRRHDGGVSKGELLREFFPNESRLDKLNLDRVLMRLHKTDNLSDFGGVIIVQNNKIFWKEIQ